MSEDLVPRLQTITSGEKEATQTKEVKSEFLMRVAVPEDTARTKCAIPSFRIAGAHRSPVTMPHALPPTQKIAQVTRPETATSPRSARARRPLCIETELDHTADSRMLTPSSLTSCSLLVLPVDCPATHRRSTCRHFQSGCFFRNHFDRAILDFEFAQHVGTSDAVHASEERV